jgi:hypothetical protein
MTTLLDESATRDDTVAGQRLRATMAAVRVMFTWFGTRKSLNAEQKAQAADAFGATGDFISAGKKLIDTRHEAFRAVTAVRGRAVGFWRSLSLPFPEPGIRLIRQTDVALLQDRMTLFAADLDEAVARLDEHYEDLKRAARQRLGRLYNANDYPPSLQGLFALSFDFPSVEPPAYLRQLSPELYRQESARAQERFAEAVRMAEAAFLDELSKLVSHLTERLSGADDGKPKIFRDSAIENLLEFFRRFRTLNVSSSEELEALVAQAQAVVSGVTPQQLRDSSTMRQQLSSQLSAVGATLDGLLVDRPRRNILRRPQG